MKKYEDIRNRLCGDMDVEDVMEAQARLRQKCILQGEELDPIIRLLGIRLTEGER